MLLFWGVNANRVNPQSTAVDPTSETYGNLTETAAPLQGTGTLRPVLRTTGAGLRVHNALGTEPDILRLLPTITVVGTLGPRNAIGVLRLLPVMTATAAMSRVGTGALTLRTGITVTAHSETGGNVEGSGTLSPSHSITVEAFIGHHTVAILALRPFLQTDAQISHTGTGTLTLQPELTGNALNAEVGSLVLRPTMTGQGFTRVQSGIWVVIPEDESGWTVQ